MIGKYLKCKFGGYKIEVAYTLAIIIGCALGWYMGTYYEFRVGIIVGIMWLGATLLVVTIFYIIKDYRHFKEAQSEGGGQE